MRTVKVAIITKWTLLSGMFAAASVLADGSGLDVPRAAEESSLAKLERVQKDPRNSLSPFTTDGCSGGLSEGWVTLGKLIPAFRDRFGERPPYESCCVVHDRAYWKGEVASGYESRLQADQALRQCVIDFGHLRREQYARDFDVTPEIIDRSFKTIADAMYYAVRIGGGPCTPFSWRWGYGWSRCEVFDGDAAD